MKDNETKQKFIELRASGYSYDKIAKELNVSKQTLIKWSAKLEHDITTAECISYATLLESYELVKQARIEKLAEQIKRVRDEINKRDLSDIPTEKLFVVLEKLNKQLSDEISGVSAVKNEDEFQYLITRSVIKELPTF